MMAFTYTLGLTESTWRTEPVYGAAAQSVTLTRTSGRATHVSVVVLLIRPQDQHDKKEEAAHDRQLQHSRHHPTAAAAAHRRQPTRAGQHAGDTRLPRLCWTGLPVDGHHRKTAAAATGERVWRNLLSGQSCQHTSFAPKEVLDQAHEFDQGYGMIPAEHSSSADPVRVHREVGRST